MFKMFWGAPFVQDFELRFHTSWVAIQIPWIEEGGTSVTFSFSSVLYKSQSVNAS